jgi:hypothetical protein
LKIRLYENHEDPRPARPWVALVFYDDGERAPVAFLSTSADKAQEAAQTWYDDELAKAAKTAGPKPKRSPKPAASPEAEEPEESF